LFEQSLEILQRDSAAPDVKERAGHAADLITEKPVSNEVKVHTVAAFLCPCSEDCPSCGCGLRYAE
jgi:hypothetical protein